MQFEYHKVAAGNEKLWSKDKNILFKKAKKFIQSDLHLKNNFFIKKFFNNKTQLYEISLKQFILQKLINVFFNYELTKSITSNKKFSYQLPNEVLKIFQDDLIKINFLGSSIKVFLFFITEQFKGIVYFLKIIFRNREKNVTNYDKKFFLNSFSKISIPNTIDLNKNSLLEWLIKNKIKKSQNYEKFKISHADKSKKYFNYKNIDITYDDVFPLPINKLSKKISFILNFFIMLIINMKDIFFFNWKNVIMFAEQVLYLNYYYCDKKELYDEYFFNNSEWLYRPLWTYAAEEKKSNISMIYYSINELPTEDISKYPDEKAYLRNFHHHEIMTWPIYYAWSNDHKNYLDYVINENYPKKIIVSNYFILESGLQFKPIKQKMTITCFPITPIEPVVNIIVQRHSNYLTYESCKSFIKDIVEYYDQFNLKVYFKLKRDFNYQSHKQYKNFYLDMLNNERFFNLDPNTDLEEIINKSDLIISAPFTSVSTVSKIKGKKTIYYDPTKTLNKPNHQKAAYNVPIIFDLKNSNLNDF